MVTYLAPKQVTQGSSDSIGLLMKMSFFKIKDKRKKIECNTILL